MAELSLMASAAFSLAPFYQDQSSCRSSKEISSIPGYGNRRDILKSASVLVGSRPVEEKLFPKNMFPTHKHPQGSIPMVEKPLLIDVQDAHHDSALLSFGIAEQCARREKILKFLFSGPGEEDDIDTSLLSNLMGLRTGAIDNYDMFSLYGIRTRNLDHMLHSARHFHIPRPLLEFISGSSNVTNIVHPNGHMLLSGGVSEIRDLLSVAAEFKILKSFTTSNKQSMVVPYFTRSRGGHARPSVQESVPSNQTAALLKSPENMKLKPSSKKRSKNASRDRDLYQANYFRACEILLSVVVDKKNNSMAILSLKKSGPEITQLLSKFSAGIAGTGLAILLSVACKTATGKVLPSSAKVLNAGLGIGFFWLSWAVNRLRETVSSISRSSNKLKLTEEEIVGRIDGSINEVLFRALALVAIVLLRFA